MTEHSLQERVVALAGVMQAAELVADIARNREPDAQAAHSSLASILITDPESTADVFGGAKGVANGLNALMARLEKPAAAGQADATRYAVTLLHLAKKLRGHKQTANQLARGIDELSQAIGSGFEGEFDPDLIERIANIYQQTISEMGPKVIINGEPEVLANPHKAATLRALLMAGIRAAVLWYQCGGSRLGLLLSRKALAREARELLKTI